MEPDLTKQIRKDLESLRAKERLGCEDYVFEWLVGEVIADVEGKKYDWPEKPSRASAGGKLKRANPA